MCIIVFDNRQSTERLDKKVLRRCLERNKDGMGIMHPDGKGGLSLWKNMKDFSGLWGRYCNARNKGLPVALHFRITTKGGNSISNCHPFLVRPKLAMMHNGTISGAIPPEGVSDTRHFRDEVLQKLPNGFLDNDSMREMIRSYISGDRMLFMDGEGNFTILNETTGSWEFTADDDLDNNGVWFSHTRDNGYFLTGVQKKFGGFNTSWYATGWESSSGYVSSSPYASRSHGDPVPTGPDGKKVRNKVSVGMKFSESQGKLLFVYGDFRDDTPGPITIPSKFASFICNGTAQNVRLWAVTDKDRDIQSRPVAYRMKAGNTYSTRGHILHVPSHFDEIDALIGIGDDDCRFQKTKVNVRVSGQQISTDNGTWSCFAYLAKPDDALNPMLAPVPHGDWDEWLSRLEFGDTLDEADKDMPPLSCTPEEKCEAGPDELHNSYVKASLGIDTVVCGTCLQEETTPFTTYPDARTGQAIEKHWYWCQICGSEYPFNTSIEYSEK